jgi:hypothetical protein
MNNKIVALLLLLICLTSWAQDEKNFSIRKKTLNEDITAFSDTRVINGHATETLGKGTFDLRITHRFGEIATPSSGRTLFGLDNSTDIRIALEYGITDELMIGLGRSKGFSPYSELWDGLVKYKIIEQNSKFPISLSVASSAFFTSMRATNDSTSITSFRKPAHRFSYYSQMLISKCWGNIFTVQLAPGILHRNYVPFGERNSLFALGGMIRYNFYGKLSLVAEYYHLFRPELATTSITYQQPLAVGLEIKTYAHVFQLNFMNSEGIGEGQFIPYTFGNWLEGQFRFGFTISRHF